MSIEHRRVAKDFDRIAEQYDTHAVLQNELLLRALLYAEHYFPRHAKILDVGCGTGLFGSKARLQNPDWIIHGVDIAFGMAKLARKHSLALVADVNALPYPDAAFDSVFSGLCLQWLGDKPRAFREMARVIRPGGRAVMTCFGKQTLIELRVAMEKAEMPVGVLTMPGMEFYTQVACDAGWRVLAVQESLTTEYVVRVEDLMRQIKRIGAGNKSESRARHLSGVKRFGTMIATYEGLYSHPLGLPATWDVITLIIEKP